MRSAWKELSLSFAKNLVISLWFLALVSMSGLMVSSCHRLFGEEPIELKEIARHAKVLLLEKCVSCHGDEKSEGALRLNSAVAMRKGGERGPVIDDLSPSKSLLLRSIDGSDDQLQMPPKNPLDATQVNLLRRWVQAGANWPEEAVNLEEATSDAWSDPNNPIRIRFGKSRLDHWSLRPISSPRLPEVRARSWALNPIDRWILSAWERQGLHPARRADRRTLIRRLSLDLTGLPVDAETVENFLRDDAPDSWERQIDTFMMSPEYGKHFARRWLDVVRYSDSNGFDWDEFRPEAWRYRDYVVQAWNRDIPFHRFIEEQLAGDELLEGPPQDEEQYQALVATGYLRMGPHDNAAGAFNEQDRSRAELMADLTETTASAFLGLTMSCCRCHDHKTEPLTHEDHYRLRAFFSRVEFGDQLVLNLPADYEEIRHRNLPIQKELEAIDDMLKKLGKEKKDEEERKKLSDQRKQIEKKLQPFQKGFLMTDSGKKDAPIFVFYQGDHKDPRKLVRPGFPSLFTPRDATIDHPSHSRTSGQRLTLARWIGSPENCWTARVLVNRLWQAHFGEGLVPSENDFGFSGSPPSHPELLDWLASEFIRSGWSIKHIQRLIVSSQTYQQVTLQNQSRLSVAEPAVVSFRTQLRRMSGEQLRDALLHATGLLQRTSGGPPIWPVLPEEVLQANPAFLDDNVEKTKGWYPSPSHQQSVRSLYLIQKRTVRLPWMECFDLPENSVSCPQRETSIVPTQALTLLNGDLTDEAATALATIARRESETKRRIRILYRHVFAREPDRTEMEVAEGFLENHSLEDLSRALLNTNEFIFIE